MAEFTKGPWIADDGDAGNWGVFSDATSDAVCYLYDTHSGAPYAADPDESAFNARLLAASPEMYEALQFALLRPCGCHSTGREEWHAISCPIPAIRAALSKADGK